VRLELVLPGSMDRATRPCPTPESDLSAPPFVSNMSDVERLLVARGTNAKVGNWSQNFGFGSELVLVEGTPMFCADVAAYQTTSNVL
jgi:hypothetical protein